MISLLMEWSIEAPAPELNFVVDDNSGDYIMVTILILLYANDTSRTVILVKSFYELLKVISEFS